MRLTFRASSAPEARRALDELLALYPSASAETADVVVALGGDGFMLEQLHEFLDRGTPIYGMNLGTVGFLLNSYRREDLPERIAAAAAVSLFPLRMRARLQGGREVEALGINEVSVFRETRQAAYSQHQDRRRVPDARAGLRRDHGGDPRRQHRLQPLRPRPDHPARRQAPGPDPDQPLPPPPLARRPALLQPPASRSTSATPASARSARSPTSPRSATC